jgi:hypothetical protein
MDVITLTALLSPCLSVLMKLGEKAAESAAGKVGEDSWNRAKKIWDKLQPKIEAKEDAKIAAQQLAVKPESEARKAVFQEELETLLKENPDLVEAIAQILQEESPASSDGQVKQSITKNEGQAVNNMSDSSKATKIDGGVRIEGGLHGNMNW